MFLCCGLGYVGSRFMAHLLDRGYLPGYGTVRSSGSSCPPSLPLGHLHRGELAHMPMAWRQSVTHLLITIPPDEGGCPVYGLWGGDGQNFPHLRAVYYLSSTGVYGDHQGAFVDETAQTRPQKPSAVHRLMAEKQWLHMGQKHKVPVFVFRLSGIYGPGRSVLDRLETPGYYCIAKEGHVFSRIHVDDIVGAMDRAYHHPHLADIYNLADDLPAPPEDVACYGAHLLHLPPPKIVSYADCAHEQSPLMDFYRSCRPIDNTRLKSKLGLTLRYPTYRDGLSAMANTNRAPS